jgi:hypothetical protein
MIVLKATSAKEHGWIRSVWSFRPMFSPPVFTECSPQSLSNKDSKLFGEVLTCALVVLPHNKAITCRRALKKANDHL